MNRLCLLSTALLLIAACGGRAEDTNLTPDPADPASWAYYCEPTPGRVIAPGMSFADSTGCNQCDCTDRSPPATCMNGVCTESLCTSAACLSKPAGAGVDFPRCTSSADCGASGTCLFDSGCAQPSGYCAGVQVSNSLGASDSYCSCQGVTVQGSAPREPYAYAGPC
jgi:hypothetical protein